jgi:hypothetical protein
MHGISAVLEWVLQHARLLVGIPSAAQFPGDPCPESPLASGDPFSFVDADTDEARTFTTYMGYWDGLARVITSTYGTAVHAPLVAELRGRKPFRSLQGSRFSGDNDVVRQLLLNAWNSELGLYLVDDNDIRLMAQNQWNNVFAYYATAASVGACTGVRVGGGVTTSEYTPVLRGELDLAA